MNFKYSLLNKTKFLLKNFTQFDTKFSKCFSVKQNYDTRKELLEYRNLMRKNNFDHNVKIKKEDKNTNLKLEDIGERNHKNKTVDNTMIPNHSDSVHEKSTNKVTNNDKKEFKNYVKWNDSGLDINKTGGLITLPKSELNNFRQKGIFERDPTIPKEKSPY
jgi:hypothetical protein